MAHTTPLTREQIHLKLKNSPSAIRNFHYSTRSIRIPDSYWSLFSVDESLYLAVMMGAYRSNLLADSLEEDGSFYYSIPRIRGKICMSRETERRVCRSLKNKWVLSTQRRSGNRRFVFLHLHTLSRLLQYQKKNKGSAESTLSAILPSQEIRSGEKQVKVTIKVKGWKQPSVLLLNPFVFNRSNNKSNLEEISMPDMFPEIANGPKKTDPLPEDIKNAHILNDALSPLRKRNGSFHAISWGHHFRLLRKMEGIDKKEIRQVLNWYVSGIDKKLKTQWMPKVRCAEEFRSKYQKIKDAMDREQKKEEKASLPLDKACQEVLSNCYTLQWKCNSGELEQAVASSAHNMRLVADRIRAKLKKLPEKDYMNYRSHPLRDALEAITSELIAPINHTLWLYIKDVWNQTRTWKEWKGNLASFSWNPDNDRTKQLLRKHSGTNKTWELVQEVIYQGGYL